MTDVMINVERMCVAENGVVDVCSCLNCGMEFADKYKHLAAELKQLREFVGAMRVVEGDGWNGNWMSDGKFGIYDADTDNLLATGTDPFDAWRNMRHERES